jgi:TonB family protein
MIANTRLVLNPVIGAAFMALAEVGRAFAPEDCIGFRFGGPVSTSNSMVTLVKTQLLRALSNSRPRARLLTLAAILALSPFAFVAELTAPGPAMAQGAERKVVKQVEPEYPLILKRAGIGGSVRLKVYVKPNGEVKDTDVIGGNPTLVEYAQRAVKQWRFSPSDSASTIEIKLTFDPKR